MQNTSKQETPATCPPPPPSVSLCPPGAPCAFLLHGLCPCTIQLCLCLRKQSANGRALACGPALIPLLDLSQHEPRRCVLQDVLQAAPSLRQKSTIRSVISLEEGVYQVFLLDLFGDRFGSQICWVLKVVRVAAPEARKRVISTLAQSKQTGEMRKDNRLWDATVVITPLCCVAITSICCDMD